MPTLSYQYRGIAGRVDPNRPVAAIVDPATNKAFDGTAWVADFARAKRCPMAPAIGDPSLYLLSLEGTWPPGLRVLAFDIPADFPLTPAESGPGAILGGPSPDPPTKFSGTLKLDGGLLTMEAVPSAPKSPTA